MNRVNHTMFWKQIFLFNKRSFIISLLVIISSTAFLIWRNNSSLISVLLILLIAGTFYFSAVSLIASYYIYDRSELYTFSRLNPFITRKTVIANLYSGYTESGHMLEEAFPHQSITHFDFFDEQTALTNSIHIARRLSKPIKSSVIKYNDWKPAEKADLILFMQSLHELRKPEEKIECLKTAENNLHPAGRIVVTEHLCDLKNFMIYGPGAFHFFGEKHWQDAFSKAGLTVESSFHITPFIKTFILKTHE